MNALQKKTSVVVVGGGLAGLVSAIELAKSGISVVLIEKNTYPFHRDASMDRSLPRFDHAV